MDDIADRLADVTISESELLAKGFCEYRRYSLTVSIPNQGEVEQKRDVIAAGKVVAVLPIDVNRDEVVLIRQFRLTSCPTRRVTRSCATPFRTRSALAAPTPRWC